MLLSIIIPIYNREQTLERCLASVQKMHLKDFEVLMIDDGSSDNSTTICKKYTLLDNRFHYYYKKNGGVSSARNYGINHAQGKWISFIDSDDWVLPNHFSFLNDNSSSKALYITRVLGISKLNNDYLLNAAAVKPIIKKISLNNFFKEKIVNSPIYLVTNKCFSNIIIKSNNLQFKDDVSLGEDQIFVAQYLSHITNIYYSNELTYIQWYGTLGSLTNSRRKIGDNYHCICKVFKSLISLSFFSRNFTVFIYALNYFTTRFWQRVIKLFIKRLIGRQ